jgi:hypothetical protein
VAGDVLTDRELNRATLARQLLLERSPMRPLEAVEHLVGLQAQLPVDPYTALWSRLEAFDPDEVGAAVADRRLVRIVAMRGTIHLLTATDALRTRHLVQPVLDAEMLRHSQFKGTLTGLDLEPVLAVARPYLAEPRSARALKAALAEAFPDLDPGALSLACRNRIPLVQTPPRGVWGRAGEVTLCDAEAWLGRPSDPTYALDDLVRRYLAAFGPASVADVAAWTRLTGLREVVDRLGPQLRTFRDERGKALVDLPDAPRPGADVEAPVRFLPEYDNALLSHADRRRFGPREVTWPDRPPRGNVLVDGEVAAVWTVVDGRLDVRHGPLPDAALRAVEAEGAGYAAFLVGPTTPVALTPFPRR